LTVAAVEDRADAIKVLAALFAAAAAVGVDGVWQHLTAAPAGFVAPSGAIVGRIAGTLEGPNQFGAYLESAIPPLVALLLLARLRAGAAIAGGLLLGVLVSDLLLTFSRGALWACLAALVFVVAAYLLARRREAQAAPLRVAAAVAVSSALVIAPLAVGAIGPSGWEHELMTAASHDPADSTQRRVQLWTCAVEVFEGHWFAGVGAGNFADAKQACGPSLAGSEHFNANQWYLETAA